MKEEDGYQGLLTLDRLPRVIKIINASICWVLALGLLFGFGSRESGLWEHMPEVKAIRSISIMFLIIGWLRISGIRWKYILYFLLLLVPGYYLGFIFFIYLFAILSR